MTVVNFVSHIEVLGLEEIHDWKNLSVVWHESFTDGVRACDKGLEDLQSNGDDFRVSGIQSSLDWDNELWNNRQYFSSTFLKHVKHTLNSKESIWVNFFSDSFKEDWQVMMIIKLLDIYFPVDFVLWTMFNGDWKISSVVEKSEFTDWNLSTVDSSGSWFKWNWLWFSLVQAEAFSSKSITLLEDLSTLSSNGNLLLINGFNFCNCTSLFLQILLWEISKG